MSVLEPSYEEEEQAEEQKTTPGVVMKHWKCDDSSNDIVLHLNLLLWLERVIVLPLGFDATLNVICNDLYLCKQGSSMNITYILVELHKKMLETLS